MKKNKKLDRKLSYLQILGGIGGFVLLFILPGRYSGPIGTSFLAFFIGPALIEMMNIKRKNKNSCKKTFKKNVFYGKLI